MKSILYKLQEDHKNFSQLLSFLEEQLQYLVDCEYCDFTSTMNAIKYMKEYPDHVHHPLENIVFRYLIEHKKIDNVILNGLLHDHDEFPVLTSKLLVMLEDAIADIPQKREDLCANLNKYISVQKKHLDQEEAHVYPILKTKLGENDWNKINSELTYIEDPLFGKKVENTYQGLLQQILD